MITVKQLIESLQDDQVRPDDLVNVHVCTMAAERRTVELFIRAESDPEWEPLVSWDTDKNPAGEPDF